MMDIPHLSKVIKNLIEKEMRLTQIKRYTLHNILQRNITNVNHYFLFLVDLDLYSALRSRSAISCSSSARSSKPIFS